MFSSNRHIESLDGLRGIAILIVFLFHYVPRDSGSFLWTISSCGWCGVDLFFVLSGFLITGILYDTRKSANYFSVFYARRALRLLPVYIVAVLVILGCTAHAERSWLEIPFFVYAANIVRIFWARAGLYPPSIECGHFWSLALEEQFYSVWPVAIFFLGSRDASRRTLMRFCVFGVIAAIALRIALIVSGAPRAIIYFELPTRVDSLLIGAFVALALRGPEGGEWLKAGRIRWIAGGFALGVLLVVLKAQTFYSGSRPMSSIGYTLLAGLFACILTRALIPGTIEHWVGSNSVLRFFGRYSYGLYVWHAIPLPICNSAVIPWFRHRIHAGALADIAYTSAMLAAFTAIAFASYHLIEAPFLRLKSKFRNSEPIPAEQSASSVESERVAV